MISSPLTIFSFLVTNVLIGNFKILFICLNLWVVVNLLLSDVCLCFELASIVIEHKQQNYACEYKDKGRQSCCIPSP